MLGRKRRRHQRCLPHYQSSWQIRTALPENRDLVADNLELVPDNRDLASENCHQEQDQVHSLSVSSTCLRHSLLAWQKQNRVQQYRLQIGGQRHIKTKLTNKSSTNNNNWKGSVEYISPRMLIMVAPSGECGWKISNMEYTVKEIRNGRHSATLSQIDPKLYSILSTTVPHNPTRLHENHSRIFCLILFSDRQIYRQMLWTTLALPSAQLITAITITADR